MRISIESTGEILELDGVPVRRWEGLTEGGVKCHVLVHRIAVPITADQAAFERELNEVPPPPDAVGRPMNLFQTFHAGEAYSIVSVADGCTIVRRMFDREIGRIEVRQSPVDERGIRLSPRGDVPYEVMERLRRMVASEIELLFGGPSWTQISERQRGQG